MRNITHSEYLMDPQSIDEILPNTLGMDEHVVEFCILHNYKIGGLTGASRVLIVCMMQKMQ